jgi:hypothetical protein
VHRAHRHIFLRAGITYALLEASGEGHCGLPTAVLLKLAGELLPVEWPGADQPDETGATSRVPLQSGQIQAALDLELAEGAMVADALAGEPAIFLAHLHRDERRIAEALLEQLQGAPPASGHQACSKRCIFNPLWSCLLRQIPLKCWINCSKSAADSPPEPDHRPAFDG